MVRPGVRRFFRLALRRTDLAAADADREIEFHLARRVEQLVAAGMTPDDARAEAERRFGDVAWARAELGASAARLEAQRTLRERIGAAADDLRYVVRSLLHSRGFTSVVVTTFALGIGANAAMFGIIDRLLLSGPAHVVESDRIARLYRYTEGGGEGTATSPHFGYVTYGLLRDHARSLERVAAYTAASPRTIGEGESAERTPVALATWDFFQMLGVRPAVGRFFAREEDSAPDGQRVIVLGHDFWARTLGRDSTIVGRTLRLDGAAYTVVGVAPPGFTGVELDPVGAWVPMSLYHPVRDWATSWRGQWLYVVGRLRPDVTPEGAGAEATEIYRRSYAGRRTGDKTATLAFHPVFFGPNGRESQELTVARWLVGVSAVVLLIACANVANLLLARGAGRRREIAVRLALGIGTGRLTRLLMLEGLLLALAGCAAGLVLAQWGGAIVRSLFLPNVLWTDGPVSAHVFLVAALLAVASGLLVALAPALHAHRFELMNALKAGSRQAGAARSRLRSGLLFAQCALSVVLLAGAGLFLRSFQQVLSVDLGFRPERLLHVQLSWPITTNDAERWRQMENGERDTYLRALDMVRARPDVRQAAIAIATPFGFAFGVDLRVPGRDSIPALGGGGPYISAVTDGYFEALGMRLVAGRFFTRDDRAGSERVTIVNEPMARTLWPGESALDKCLLINNDTLPCARIVGVVGEVRRNRLREAPAMQYYVPYGQHVGFSGSALLIEAAGSVDELAPRVQRAIRELVPSALYVQARPMLASIDPLRRQWKLGAALFGIFGVLALGIAAVGLYSVIAYVVAQRTLEFGVRLALGATARPIVALVLRRGMAVAIAGLAAGVAAALLGGRFIEPLLFETSSRDPLVFAAVTATLLLVALAACLVPAARASRVDPATALRAD